MEYLGRTDFVHKPAIDIESHASVTPAAAQVTYQEQPKPVAEVTPPSEPSDLPKSSPVMDSKDAGTNGGATPENSPQPVMTRSYEKNTESVTLSVLDEQLSQMMGDAPFCNICGHITVRSGSCYKCLNCGNSMGCS